MAMTWIGSAIVCLLSALLFVVGDVVLDILVLLEQKPEHAVKFLGRLDGDLLMGLHVCKFLLEVLDADNLVVWELVLVVHEVLVGADKVLLQLVVEGLSRYLHTDAEHNLDVDDLLLECCVQYPQMSLPRLLNWIFSLVLCRHDLIQMNFIIKKIIKL